MNRVFVDQNGFEYVRYLSADPRMKYVEGEVTDQQDTDENGVPLYNLVCLAKQAGSNKPETISVKVPFPQPPAFEEFTKLGFIGLTALAYNSGNRAQLSFAAEKAGKTKE